MIKTSTYHANGKLLLSGEYFVLHGAKALALPLKMGQQLIIKHEPTSVSLNWKAFHKGQSWFECALDPISFEVISTTDPDKASTLSLIFKTISMLNPSFQPLPGTRCETILEANPEWGFGSSSTLISLLAQWAELNPFRLNDLIFKGSGFDIACATAQGPIVYTKQQPVQPVKLDYPFAPQLYFVYSGNKKKTFPEVSAFLQNTKVTAAMAVEMSVLTEEFACCTNQQTFHQLIRQHETMVGNLIGQKPVKQAYFDDFNGEVKSLGAWGGDYLLFSSLLSEAEIKKYFENKGLNIIFRWNELIKS